MTNVDVADTRIHSLGEPRIDSPLRKLLGGTHEAHFVDEVERVRVFDHLPAADADEASENGPVAFELAGPRARIYFEPAKLRCGIVTCGGLCPGINDVVRGLVLALWNQYGVRGILGFRYGLQGFVPRYHHPVVELDPSAVAGIHQTGGTMLGTSRGRQDLDEVVDCVERMNLGALFVIGGGGTMRAALGMAERLASRDLKCVVVGVPKAIDNDLMFIERSFGFETAYAEAVKSIRTACVEAMGSPAGVGLVRLMGRHSGFIASHATLASGDVDFTLIPEVPFRLDGEGGVLDALEQRLAQRGHAVIVAAEGAGRHVPRRSEPPPKDVGSTMGAAEDVGELLQQAIRQHFAAKNLELNLRYVDPSYDIRSVPASASDSIYCLRLAQNAAHAALCGKTAVVVGDWHGSLVHVPMKLAGSGRKQVDTRGDLWLSVLEDTGQPAHWR